MEHDMVAGPLKAALAAKGYQSLTPVQEAVLDANLLGRDLLVSAQTGSGKTVAFGLAMAPEVLDGIDHLLPAEAPLALVIAPTRELALQVKAEFEWLYKDAGAVIASCVGGMDYRTERRALQQGAHIVVGTPGRLRDHVERNSLDLSQLKAVVLDEADEMLDMGFAEDLEFILGNAPEEKRVLMFSATVPKEIAKLAETYQREARRVEVKSAAAQHQDISHIAISVSARDREPAIFNLLRWHDSKLSIVFCKTRANVNHLHARMVNRGFPVVALSGELSQSERLHALQALRDGRARVCIATDVAARGIDLPGLDLVIHADVPGSSETLLHRSGRTGRAGNKGTSVMVVAPSEFRKAQRLYQGAKVVAEWGKAPGADDVQAREDERLMNDAALTADIGEEAAMAASILELHAPEAVAAAYVRLWRAGRSAPETLVEDLPPPAALPPRERGEFGPAVWYRLTVGHTGRAEARWLLPKICDAGSIAKDGIGAIRVREDETFVQIAAPLESRFGAMVEIEPGLTMTRVEGEPDFGPGKPRAPGGKFGGGKFGDKPRAPRGEGDDRGPRKPWAPREGGDREFTPRAPREDRAPRGEWKPREDRAPREDRGDRKPWAPKNDAPRGFDRAERAPREDRAPRGEWKPREDRDGDRPAKAPYRADGFRSHGGGAEGRPARSGGFKSHGGPREGGFERRERPEGDAGRKPYAAKGSDARPFARREGGDKPAGKSFGSKSFGDKPAGKFDGGFKKPGAPKGDARDPSKRFQPPKKPR